MDATLLDHAPKVPLREMRRLQARLESGQYLAERRYKAFPCSADDFIATTLEIHFVRFRGALPDIAGRFRREDEVVEFGGGGQNRLEGAHASQIGAELRRLHRDAMDSFHNPRSDEPAHRCAVFLEHFFRVHPFVDGNGRVGRQLARLLCEMDEVHTFRAFRTDAPWRLRYLNALEYAHRHSPGSENPSRDPHQADYCRYLRRWLADEVIRPIENLEELPPQWLLDHSEDDPDY